MNWAKESIKERGKAVLVEGMTDVLLAHQHGFKNTIGTFGTGLSVEKIKILNDITQKVIMVLEGNFISQQRYNVSRLMREGFKVIKVVLEQGSPAEILSEKPRRWQSLLEDEEMRQDKESVVAEWLENRIIAMTRQILRMNNYVEIEKIEKKITILKELYRSEIKIAVIDDEAMEEGLERDLCPL